MVFFHIIGQEEEECHRWLRSDIQDWEGLKEHQLFTRLILLTIVESVESSSLKKYIGSAHSEGDFQDLLLVVNEQKTNLRILNKVVNNLCFNLLLFKRYKLMNFEPGFNKFSSKTENYLKLNSYLFIMLV